MFQLKHKLSKQVVFYSNEVSRLVRRKELKGKSKECACNKENKIKIMKVKKSYKHETRLKKLTLKNEL